MHARTSFEEDEILHKQSCVSRPIPEASRQLLRHLVEGTHFSRGIVTTARVSRVNDSRKELIDWYTTGKTLATVGTLGGSVVRSESGNRLSQRGERVAGAYACARTAGLYRAGVRS